VRHQACSHLHWRLQFLWLSLLLLLLGFQQIETLARSVLQIVMRGLHYFALLFLSQTPFECLYQFHLTPLCTNDGLKLPSCRNRLMPVTLLLPAVCQRQHNGFDRLRAQLVEHNLISSCHRLFQVIIILVVR
jgi:hypothetical protein